MLPCGAGRGEAGRSRNRDSGWRPSSRKPADWIGSARIRAPGSCRGITWASWESRYTRLSYWKAQAPALPALSPGMERCPRCSRMEPAGAVSSLDPVCPLGGSVHRAAARLRSHVNQGLPDTQCCSWRSSGPRWGRGNVPSLRGPAHVRALPPTRERTTRHFPHRG